MKPHAVVHIASCCGDDGAIAPHRLIAALKQLSADCLPLHVACTQGGVVGSDNLSFSLLSTRAHNGRQRARVGVFFTEIVGGCNCHDDPHETPAYAVLELSIDCDGDRADVWVDSEAGVGTDG